MTVQIPFELEDSVLEFVKAGTFQNETEVIAEALRLLQQREQLRHDVGAGIQQLEQGLGIPGDMVFDRLQRKANSLVAQTGSGE